MAQVKTWGILVYDRAPWLEDMTEAQALAEGYSKRDFYGHVEIAQWSGNYFWGTTKNSPGGSVDASKDPDAARFIGKVYYPKVEIA
jgi:hypothetical protein